MYVVYVILLLFYNKNSSTFINVIRVANMEILEDYNEIIYCVDNLNSFQKKKKNQIARK